MLAGLSRATLVTHVDVFQRGPDGEQKLISTTRPCPDCGQPLVGLVVEDRSGRQKCGACRMKETL